MLVVTSPLLPPLLLCMCINIHFVSGEQEKGVQQGLGCKANGLARDLNQKFKQYLNKQRVKARNGKIKGESASRMGQIKMALKLLKAFKRQLNTVEGCLGGAELEAQLEKAIDIMNDVDRVKKIHTKMEAKLGKLIEKEKGGKDYFDLAALGPIIQAGLPIALQMLQVLWQPLKNHLPSRC